MDDYKKTTEENMNKALAHFSDELKKIRTGRASTQVLENVMVEVYGSRSPLQHIANSAVLDAQTLQITPFDPGTIQAIANAIREDQSLGLNPVDDGRVVRIPIPPLTEERRRDIVKSINEKAESTRVALRNVRHETLKGMQAEEKDGQISKDDLRAVEKDLNSLIDNFQAKIEELVKVKEKEVMTV